MQAIPLALGPETAPNPSPGRFSLLLRHIIRLAAQLFLMAAVSAASAYLIFEWRIQQQQRGTAARLEALQAEMGQAEANLEQKLLKAEQQILQVQEAAQSARLLLEQNGELTSLDARLREIDTLRLDLQKSKEDAEAKFKTLERSIGEQIAKQGRETAQALSLELRWKSLLIKAQGEVLLAQIHWAEGNRGLARDELGIAAGSIRKALESAPETEREHLGKLAEIAEQARTALILEQSAARDSLNLLWHRVSELLAVTPKGQ